MRYLALSEVVDLTGDFSNRPAGSPGFRISAPWNRPWLSPRWRWPVANKRVGHAAMETFLVLNGAEIDAGLDEQERVMLDLAAGRIDRGQLADWLHHQLKPLA